MNDPDWTLQHEPLQLTREQTDELILRHGEVRALDLIQRHIVHALKRLNVWVRP